MLDTYARKVIQPYVERVADLCIAINLKADQVTLGAFLLGILSSLLVLLDFSFTGVTLLWVSGFLDAVDGTIARTRGSSSQWGTVLDITGDRLVEIAIILALAIRFPDSRMALLILISTILFSMTVFLTVGALSQKRSEKSFYYQAGLTERTEGFILFSLMIIFSGYLSLLTLFFAFLVIITGIQRMVEAHRLLKD